jgi:hypothetical protein
MLIVLRHMTLGDRLSYGDRTASCSVLQRNTMAEGREGCYKQNDEPK